MKTLGATLCALLVLLLTSLATTTHAQEPGELPALDDSDAFDAGAPMVESGGGSYFSQELGTLLRLRYNTESYGQDRRGNFDIGTMQVQNFDDAIAFFDGQVTLSDVNGVGYNLGLGYRQLGWTPLLLEPERISGLSIWADGTSTESGDFFPQVGVSFESLGELWDLRVNGYIPIGKESQVGNFTTTGDVVFDENFLVLEALADRNTSFNVAEAEIARRIMPDRDAWAFAGPYVLANSVEDAAGYRIGMRGYAYPDLLLQIAVSDDDIFKTNAAFQVTWFVGRTRSDYRPACGLADRMREPVMRNDYVALRRTTETGGEALTNTDGDPIRFVHVDSAAPDGGNGTYESPLNNVGNVQPNSQDGDIVLLWANSNFNAQNTLVLQDNQRLLGEGDGQTFTVTTEQKGIVDIPETSPGARDGARPVIMNALGLGAVQLADANEVTNFNINGSAGAGIFSPATGAGNPNIHDLDISNTTGDGIQTTPFTRTDPDNAALKTVAGNVTIDEVVFDNIGGDDININAETTEDVTDPNVTLQETIAISNVTSTNGGGRGVWLRNTHNNRTATITNYMNGTSGTAGSGGGLLASGVLVFEGSAVDQFEGDLTLTNIDIFENTGYALHYSNIDANSATTITNNNGLTWNGAAGAAGGLRFNNFNGTFTGNSSTLTNGTLSGVAVTGTSDGTITLNSSVTFDSIDPAAATDAVINVGPNMADSFTGSLTVSGAITNHDTGRLVSLQHLGNSTAAVTLTGDMTDVANAGSTGIFIGSNTDGTILFSGNLTVNTTNSHAIQLLDNADTDISFGGVLDLVADGAGANAFDAENGGTLTVSNTGNTISTDGGIGVRIVDVAIANAGANFSEVNVTGGATNGVFLQDNTGGPITIGALGDPGDSGTIENTTGDAIVINNSANVTVSSLIVNATAGQSGVMVNKTTNGTQTVNLNDLEINDGAIGIEVTGSGNASATLNMTVNDNTINDSTSRGISIDNVDAGTILVNGTTIDGDTANASAQGVEIVGSNATITFDGDTAISNFAGTSFEVDGGTGNVTYSGDITSTIGESVRVQNRTGGTVNLSSTSNVTDTGGGVRVTANTAGTVNFNGILDLDTTTNTAVLLTNNSGSTINFTPPSANPLDINTTTGNGFVATGGGTLTVAGTNNSITTTTGTGLQIEGMTIGSVDFESVDVNGATNGIRLVDNTGGTITVGDTGAAVGAGGTIQNTTDAGVHVENSNVTLNGVTVQNAGDVNGENGVEILHTNSTTMNANLNRLTVTNATPLRDGVVIDGTGGSGTFNANIQNLNVNVTGDGLTVTDGVTLTAGGTNTITSATGVGLTVSDSTIAAAGANFQSVNVTAGATSGILLSNLTGGQLAVTGTGTTTNSGGSLTTTGTAIAMTNVANVDIDNVRIINSAVGVEIDHTNAATTTMDVTIDNLNLDDATGDGINVSADNDAFSFAFRLTDSDIDNAGVVVDVTGAGQFGMLVDNTDITTDAGIAGRAFDFQVHDGATDVDATFRNGNNFVASDGEGLFIDSFDATPKDVKINIQDSSFADTLGTEIAADIRNRGTSLMQLTVQGNTFASAGAARDFSAASSGTAGSQIRLNLGGDVTSPADFNSAVGQGTFLVSQSGTSVFGIFQRDDTLNDLRNNEPVDTNGGTFQNLVIAPDLPIVP